MAVNTEKTLGADLEQTWSGLGANRISVREENQKLTLFEELSLKTSVLPTKLKLEEKTTAQHLLDPRFEWLIKNGRNRE